jgi:hypothetical protein
MTVCGNTAGRIPVRTNGSMCFVFLIFHGSLRILHDQSFLITKPNNPVIDGSTV